MTNGTTDNGAHNTGPHNTDSHNASPHGTGPQGHGTNNNSGTGYGPTNAGTAYAPNNGPAASGFFDWIRGLGLVRGEDAWIGGVCGAVASRIGLDPIIVRGVAIVVAILGGPIFLFYAIGWALLPDRSGVSYLQRAIRGEFHPAMIAIGVIAILTFVPFMHGIWWQGPPAIWGMPDWLEITLRTGWSVAVIGGLIWLVVYLSRRMPRRGNWAPNHYTPPYAPSNSTGFSPAGNAGFEGANFSNSEDSTATAGANYATGTNGTTETTGTAETTETTGTAGATGTDESATQTKPYRTAEPVWAAAAAAFGAPTWGDPANDTAGTSASSGPWSNSSDTSNSAYRPPYRPGRSPEDQAARVATWRAMQPGPAFTVITLGIALVVGAIASAGFAAGAWSQGALVVGLAAAAAVLAVGIVTAGIRGRTSGAMNPFAIILVIVLVAVGVFPQGTRFSPVGSTMHEVSSVSQSDAVSYGMIAGEQTLDLTGLDSATAELGGTIDVWLVVGQVQVELPARASVVLESNVLVGNITYPESANPNSLSGLFLHHAEPFNESSSRDVTRVRIWTLVGNADVKTSSAPAVVGMVN